MEDSGQDYSLLPNLLENEEGDEVGALNIDDAEPNEGEKGRSQSGSGRAPAGAGVTSAAGVKFRKRRRSASSSSSSTLSTSSATDTTTPSTSTDSDSTSSSQTTSTGSTSSTSTSTSATSRSSSESVLELIPPTTRARTVVTANGQSLESEEVLDQDLDRELPEEELKVERPVGSAEQKPLEVVRQASGIQRQAAKNSAVAPSQRLNQEVKKTGDVGNSSSGGISSSISIEINWYANRIEALKGSLADLGLDPHLWGHPNSILFAVLMMTVQEGSDDDDEEEGSGVNEMQTSEVVQRFRGAKELFGKTLKLEYEAQRKKATMTAVTSGGANKAGTELTHFLWKNTGELAEHFAILCDQAEDLYHALPSGLMQVLIDALQYQGTNGSPNSAKMTATTTASKPTTRGSTAAAGLAQKCPFRQAFMMWVLPAFLQRVCAPYPPAGLLHLSNPPFALGISSSGSSASNTRSKFQTKIEDWFSGGTRYTAAHSHTGGAASSASPSNKSSTLKSSSNSTAAPVVKRNVEFASREQRLEKLLLFMRQGGSLVDLKSLGGCRSVTVVVQVDPKTGTSTQRSVTALTAPTPATARSHRKKESTTISTKEEVSAGKANKIKDGSKPLASSQPSPKTGISSKSTTTTALLNALARFPSPLASSFADEGNEDDEEEEAGWLTLSVRSVSAPLPDETAPMPWWKSLERLLLDGLSPADRTELDPRGVAATASGTKAAKGSHLDPIGTSKRGRWIDAMSVSMSSWRGPVPPATHHKNTRPPGRPRTVNLPGAGDTALKYQILTSKSVVPLPSGGPPTTANSLIYDLDLRSNYDDAAVATQPFDCTQQQGPLPMDPNTFVAQVTMMELMTWDAEKDEVPVEESETFQSTLPLGVAIPPCKVARTLFQHLLSVCRLPFHGKDREEKDRLWQFIKCCHEATYFSDSGFHRFLAEVIDELILDQSQREDGDAVRQTFADFEGFRVLADWLKLAQVRLEDRTCQRVVAILRRYQDLDQGVHRDASASIDLSTSSVIPFVEIHYTGLN